MTADPPRWLDKEERQAWLGLLAVSSLLPAALDTQLQRDAGLSAFEYLVLAMLSEDPGRTVQLKQLAMLANGSQSRLSHGLTRLERRGYVVRRPDPDNGRITMAELTEVGYDVVVAAAPDHVTAVRELVFDGLTATQTRQLAAILSQLATRLGEARP